MTSAIAPIQRNALLKALQRSLGFNAQDLERNSQGKLGTGQRLHLLDRAGPTLGASMLAVVIWFALWLVYATWIKKLPASDAITQVVRRLLQPQLIWSSVDVYGPFNGAPLLYSGAAVSLVLLILGGLCSLPWKLILDTLGGTVYVIVGRVETEQAEKLARGQPDGILRYYYRLREDERFEVSRQAHDALDSGGLYSVYYLPRSRTVVAVEPRMEAVRMPTPLSEGPLPSLHLHTGPDPR